MRNDGQLPRPAPDSFENLYEQYVGTVYQKCLSMTKDAEAAQDFTQDIFIKVFHKLDSFENRSSFSTWLYSVAHNYCLDQLKAGKRLSTESLSDKVVNALAQEDPSDPVESQLLTLEGVMGSLSAEELTLLRLKYEQGTPVKAIAQRFDLSESAVKMRLKRTRAKLYALYLSQEYR
ncbi:RNA polymerase sigma factor [Spirosoma arcticum]